MILVIRVVIIIVTRQGRSKQAGDDQKENTQVYTDEEVPYDKKTAWLCPIKGEIGGLNDILNAVCEPSRS